jgi:hypothetical protein
MAAHLAALQPVLAEAAGLASMVPVGETEGVLA